MLFQMALEFIYKNIFLNILILILIIWACVAAYHNSVKSRKYFVCPHCGESFRTEYSSSKCCKVCGAPLEEKADSDVNDSAKENL